MSAPRYCRAVSMFHATDVLRLHGVASEYSGRLTTRLPREPSARPVSRLMSTAADSVSDQRLPSTRLSV